MVIKNDSDGILQWIFLSSIFRNSIKSELLCVSLTNGMASHVRRSIPANKESVPRRLYSASRYTSPFSVVGRKSGAVLEIACMHGFHHMIP